MKIIREIAGQRIELNLTDAEMESAYAEKNSQYLREDVKRLIEEQGYEDVKNIPDDLFQKLCEDYDDRRNSSRVTDIECVINNHAERLEEYRETMKVYTVTVTATVKAQYTIAAKNEQEAAVAFEIYSDRHYDKIGHDLAENIDESDTYIDTSDPEEDEYTDVENADIDREGNKL